MADFFNNINDQKTIDDPGSAFNKYFVSERKHKSPNVDKIIRNINSNLKETYKLDKIMNKNLKSIENSQTQFESKGIQNYSNYINNNSLNNNNIIVSDLKANNESGFMDVKNENKYKQIIGDEPIQILNLPTENKFGVKLFDDISQQENKSILTSGISNIYKSIPSGADLIQNTTSNLGYSMASNYISDKIGLPKSISSGLSVAAPLVAPMALESLGFSAAAAGPIGIGLAAVGGLAYGISSLFSNDSPEPPPQQQRQSQISENNNEISYAMDNNITSYNTPETENVNIQNQNNQNLLLNSENDKNKDGTDQPAEPENANTGPSKPGDPTQSLLPDESEIENRFGLLHNRQPFDLNFNANNAISFSGNQSTFRRGFNSNFKRQKF